MKIGLSDFTFTFHFHSLEKEVAPHCSAPAWRIPGTVEPGGLPSVGSHRVGHNCSDTADAGAGKMAATSEGPNPRGLWEGWVESASWAGSPWAVQEEGAGRWVESGLGSLLRVLLGYNTFFHVPPLPKNLRASKNFPSEKGP